MENFNIKGVLSFKLCCVMCILISSKLVTSDIFPLSNMRKKLPTKTNCNIEKHPLCKPLLTCN